MKVRSLVSCAVPWVVLAVCAVALGACQEGVERLGEDGGRRLEAQDAEYGRFSSRLVALGKDVAGREVGLWAFLRSLPPERSGHSWEIGSLQASAARALAADMQSREQPVRLAMLFRDFLRRGWPARNVGADALLATPEYVVGEQGFYLLASDSPEVLVAVLEDVEPKVLVPVLRGVEYACKRSGRCGHMSVGTRRLLQGQVIRLLENSDAVVEIQAVRTAQELANSEEEAIRILREFLRIPGVSESAAQFARAVLSVREGGR